MNAWANLHAATLELSKGSPLKQRLMTVFSNHLTQLDAGEIPPPTRVDLRSLLAAFEAVTPLRGETAVQATVRKLSNEQAEELAARVVMLFGQVARLSGPRPVQEPAWATEPADPDAAVTPLFAAEA